MRMHYPYCKEWGTYPPFYEWAMQNGYSIGAWLRRVNDFEPYSPDNCVWYISDADQNRVPLSWADDWNKSVNRIRKHYGMPPLEGTTYDNL